MKGDVFEPNALVFAKIRGYPAWPARITAALDESKKPKKYSVFFFGTYEVATVRVEDLYAYNAQTKEKYGNVNVKRKGFLEAMQEIEGSPDLEVSGLPVLAPTTPRSVPSAAATATPSSTPRGRGRGKKRKEDGATPLGPAGKRRRLDSGDAPGAATTPVEPVLSRSGRQIKPKRFADADEGKKSLAGGRRQTAAAQSSGAGDDSVIREGEYDEEEEEEVLPMEMAADGEGGAGDGPEEEAAQPMDEHDVSPEPERRDVRYKPYPAHNTEDIVRVADSASVQQQDDGRKVMYVKAKCGEMLEIDISDRERPKEFKSEKARIMWDTATAINLSRLRHQLEQGEYIPDRLREKLLARADIAEDYKDKLKTEKRAEMRKSKLWWLRDEARMIEMDYHIKLNLIIDEQDHEKCIQVFKELAEMNMAPLMLKKNPEIVETVRKCRKYTGSAEIRELADKCYQKFKKMFVVPKGKMFREYFDEQLAIFRKVTEDMPEEKVIRMVRDPLYQRPGEASSDSEDEAWPPAPPKTNGTADHADGEQKDDQTADQQQHEEATEAAQQPEEPTADDGNAGDAAPAADTEEGAESSDKPATAEAESAAETETKMETADGGDSPQKETGAQPETEAEPAAEQQQQQKKEEEQEQQEDEQEEEQKEGQDDQEEQPDKPAAAEQDTTAEEPTDTASTEEAAPDTPSESTAPATADHPEPPSDQ